MSGEEKRKGVKQVYLMLIALAFIAGGILSGCHNQPAAKKTLCTHKTHKTHRVARLTKRHIRGSEDKGTELVDASVGGNQFVTIYTYNGSLFTAYDLSVIDFDGKNASESIYYDMVDNGVTVIEDNAGPDIDNGGDEDDGISPTWNTYSVNPLAEKFNSGTSDGKLVFKSGSFLLNNVVSVNTDGKGNLVFGTAVATPGPNAPTIAPGSMSAPNSANDAILLPSNQFLQIFQDVTSTGTTYDLCVVNYLNEKTATVYSYVDMANNPIGITADSNGNLDIDNGGNVSVYKRHIHPHPVTLSLGKAVFGPNGIITDDNNKDFALNTVVYVSGDGSGTVVFGVVDTEPAKIMY